MDSLVKLNSDSLFNSANWISLFNQNEIKLMGIFNKNNELNGCFYYFIKKRMRFLNQISSVPFTPNCSLYVKIETSNISNTNTFKKNIMKLVAEWLEKESQDIITLGFPSEFVDFQPFTWKGFKVIPNYTYRINLNLSEKEINGNLSPKTRNIIKKGEKDGLQVELSSDYSQIQTIVKNSFLRNKVSVNETIMDDILFKFANPTNSFSYIVTKEDKPIAGTFCIYDNHRCYYLLGGYESDNSHPGAGPMAVYSSILKSKEIGISEFDFEGSMIPPIESYFRSFGGEITPYYTVNKANFLVEMLLKLKKRAIF